jgi:hypothetical protein
MIRNFKKGIKINLNSYPKPIKTVFGITKRKKVNHDKTLQP